MWLPPSNVSEILQMRDLSAVKDLDHHVWIGDLSKDLWNGWKHDGWMVFDALFTFHRLTMVDNAVAVTRTCFWGAFFCVVRVRPLRWWQCSVAHDVFLTKIGLTSRIPSTKKNWQPEWRDYPGRNDTPLVLPFRSSRLLSRSGQVRTSFRTGRRRPVNLSFAIAPWPSASKDGSALGEDYERYDTVLL